jgi:hypothetical protein
MNKEMTALIPTYTTRILMEKELYKLCYIEKCFAYFTTQDLDKQWGDDWDDAPYEHNAGEPYAPSLRYFTADRQEKVETDWNADGTPKWEIMKIAFYCPSAATPAELASSNSPYSVEMINNKLVPWLIVHWRMPPDKGLFAGASIDEFVEFIEESGGEIFFPKSLLQVA